MQYLCFSFLGCRNDLCLSTMRVLPMIVWALFALLPLTIAMKYVIFECVMRISQLKIQQDSWFVSTYVAYFTFMFTFKPYFPILNQSFIILLWRPFQLFRQILGICTLTTTRLWIFSFFLFCFFNDEVNEYDSRRHSDLIQYT